MARPAPGEINRSQLIRDLLAKNPKIKASEAIAALGEKGIIIKKGLFYLVKGSVAGGKKRRQKVQRNAVAVAVASDAHPSPAGALATIRRIKTLAVEVGGMRTLKQLVDVLSE